MKKFVVALGLGKLSTAEKIELGHTIVTAMTGNVNFILPNPKLIDVSAAILALETAVFNVDSQGGGTLLTSIMHAKERELEDLLTAEGNYVDSIAKGSETIILSAGMKTKKQSAPIGIPVQVQGMKASAGAQTGKILLKWSNVKGGRAYIVYMSEDVNAPASWRVIGYPTAASFTAASLVAGSEHWFKVEAIGSAGVGHASDPASAHAAF